MVRLIRFSLVLCFLLFVSSPLFADTLVRSGEAFDRGFVVLSDSHPSTFHADFLRGYASADADFDWTAWAQNKVNDSDSDHGHHWGWYNEHKHRHEHIIYSKGGGWDDDDGSSKSDPAVPEPSVLVLLVSGLVGLFLASALNKLRA